MNVGASASELSGFFMRSMPWPRVDRVEGINGVVSWIKSKNHIYSILEEGLVFNRAHVWSLGIRIERC